MSKIQLQPNVYGFESPLSQLPYSPIIANRAPTTTDYTAIGRLWVYPATNQSWFLVSIVSNVATWNLNESSGGGGAFSTLTSTGNTSLATGTGSTFAVGNTTGAVTIGGTGASTGTISIAPGTGAQTIDIGHASTGAKTINIGDGAVANTITIGNVTGATEVNILAGTGNLNIGATTLVTGTLEAETLYASADEGGVASTTGLSNVTVAAGATGVFVIKASSGSGTTASAGFLKMYVGTTAIYVPYWTQTT